MLHFDAIPPKLKELLEALTPARALGSFALGGGTSLALRFGHRMSVDLDFFTLESFDPSEIAAEIPINGTTVASSINSLTLDIAGMKVDLLRHAYPLLEPVETVETIALLSIEDVAAMKLNALANRGSKKDFYDLAELLKHQSAANLVSLFSRKYPRADAFTLIRSLAWFEDAEQEPDPVSLNGTTWCQVKDIARRAVASL